MLVKVLKSKLHRARVTATHLDYSGSLTIDEDLMDAVGIVPYEALLMGNLANGARAETYAIAGRRGSGEIVLNGAVARLGSPGDLLVVLVYAWVEQAEAVGWRPKVSILDADNAIAETVG